MKLLTLIPLVWSIVSEFIDDLKDRDLDEQESARIGSKLAKLGVAIAPGLSTHARAGLASAFRSAATEIEHAA